MPIYTVPLRDATSALGCSDAGRPAMNCRRRRTFHAQASAAADRPLKSYALPQQPTPVPLLVFYGNVDPIILPQWTAAALERACALGDTVLRLRVDGAGHDVHPGPTAGPVDRRPFPR